MSKIPLVLGLMLLVSVTASACAPAGTMGSRDANVITAEELQAVQASNLHDAIQRLRPRWLTVRAPQTFGAGAGFTRILVYQNQARLGGLEVLRDMGLDTAMWLEYLDRTSATSRLPSTTGQDVEGAIIVHTTPREGAGAE
jgi:hypothetical protein